MTTSYADRASAARTSKAIKVPCAVATTADITLSGEQTIDGVTTSESRVLVKNQSTGSENGIYTSGSGAWTRTADFDASGDVTTGTLVRVTGGTAGKGVWELTTTGSISIGTTALTFAAITGVLSGVSEFMATVLDDTTAAAARATLLLPTQKQCILANNSGDANHDIDFGGFSLWDSARTTLIERATTITKRIDAAWSAGTGNGGMFTGSVGVNTCYHCFVIRKDDGTVDAGFDTSITANNIPTGYTAYKYVGSIRSNASSNITAFRQLGLDVVWDAPYGPIGVTSAGTQEIVSLAAGMPIDLELTVLLGCQIQHAASASGLSVGHPDQVFTSGIYNVIINPVTAQAAQCPAKAQTDTGARVDMMGVPASSSVALYVLGWSYAPNDVM